MRKWWTEYTDEDIFSQCFMLLGALGNEVKDKAPELEALKRRLLKLALDERIRKVLTADTVRAKKPMFWFLQGIVRDGELHAWRWVQHSKISDHAVVSRVEIKKAPVVATTEAS